MKDKPANAKKEVKRLAITQDVLRELFLKSGNLCAFPGCNRPVMNSEGIFIGQICHIEAAEEGGERFNEQQTNEQRRSFGNLMLLCYEHHTITNDVNAYPTERMQAMKAAHENKVFEFIEHIQLRVSDLTKLSMPKHAASIGKLLKLWNTTFTPVELEATLEELAKFAERIRHLPVPVRQVLAIAVERSTHDQLNRRFVSAHEVRIAGGISDDLFAQLWQILDTHRFIIYGGEDDYGQSIFVMPDPPSGWDIWSDFKKLVANGQVTMVELVVDLNFRLLD